MSRGIKNCFTDSHQKRVFWIKNTRRVKFVKMHKIFWKRPNSLMFCFIKIIFNFFSINSYVEIFYIFFFINFVYKKRNNIKCSHIIILYFKLAMNIFIRHFLRVLCQSFWHIVKNWFVSFTLWNNSNDKKKY